MRSRPPARSASNGSTSSSNGGTKPKSTTSSNGNGAESAKGSTSDSSVKEKSTLTGTNAGGGDGVGSKSSASSSGGTSVSVAGTSSKLASISGSTGGGTGGGMSKTSSGSNNASSSGTKLNSSTQSKKLSQDPSSGQGNQNSSNNNNNSNQSKKKKKSQATERKDLSLLHRVPTDTAMSGVHDIVNAVTSGTDELCDIIINECYVVYECKVCRNFFRNIITFFQHKKSFCTNRFTQMRDTFLDKEVQEKSMFFNNGTKGHVLFSRKTSRRDILEILDKIAERRVETEPSFVAFREMCDTASALLTAVVPERKSDERSATITLPPSSPARTSSGPQNHSENHNGVRHQSPSSASGHHLESQEKIPCPKCDKDFPSKFSLETHVNTVHPDVRLGYLCPCCDQVFVNSWCVNRHLTTAHKKNREEVRKLRHKIGKKLVPTETLFPERGSRRRATSFSSSSNDDDSDEDDKKEPEITFPCSHCTRTFQRKAAMISHRNYCRLRDPDQRVPPIHSTPSSSIKRPRSPSVESYHSDKKGKVMSSGGGGNDVKISEISEPRVRLTRTPMPGPVERKPVDDKKELEASEINEILGIKSDSVVNTPTKEEEVEGEEKDSQENEIEPTKDKPAKKIKSILDPPDEPQEILSCPGCHRIFLRKAAMASHAILCRVKPDSNRPSPAKKPRVRRPSEIQKTPMNVIGESQESPVLSRPVSSNVGLKSAQSDTVEVFDIEDFLGVKLSSQVNFINAEDSGQDISSHFVNKGIKKEEEEEEEEEEPGDSGSSGKSSASGDSAVDDDAPDINGENDYSETEYDSESDRDGEGFEDFENALNAATTGPSGDKQETEEDEVCEMEVTNMAEECEMEASNVDEECEMEASNVDEEEEDSAITVLGSSEVEENNRVGEAAASGSDCDDVSNVWSTEVQSTTEVSNAGQDDANPENVSFKVEEDEEYDEGGYQSKGSNDDGSQSERDFSRDEWIRDKLNTFVDPKCKECLICFQRFRRLVFKRWGNRLNISGDKSKKAPLCEELENVYVKEGVQVMHASERLSRISVGTGLSPALVYKWFKIRRLQDEVSDLDKFVEDCWLALLTTLLSTLGFLIINDQSFNLDSYWGNYPLERVGLCQELYYLAGMAFFVVDSVVLVTKRHETFDLPLRIYHHTLSFLLMGVSWTSNEVRVGCLILLTFETSSPLGYKDC